MEYRITPGRSEIGKFSLYYERVGAGAPIVFLHGLGGNHLSWWQQVPYFMRSFECITVDQRGFGLSRDTDGVFNRAHASDLGALLDYLKIDKAVLIGQSMGGWTIVGYALEHPECVAAMVMADTPGGIFTPDMKFEAPRTPLPVDASPPIGSLPTYAADYFTKHPEMAFLYDEVRVLGARPPADAGARIIGLRYDLSRGEATPDDADTVHGWRTRHADQTRHRQGTGVGPAQRAAADGARQRSLDLFRERPGVQSTGARLPARGWLREVALLRLAPRGERPTLVLERRVRDQIF